MTTQPDPVNDVLIEGETLLAEAQPNSRGSIWFKPELYDWLEAHAEALVRIARQADRVESITRDEWRCDELEGALRELRAAIDSLWTDET